MRKRRRQPSPTSGTSSALKSPGQTVTHLVLAVFVASAYLFGWRGLMVPSSDGTPTSEGVFMMYVTSLMAVPAVSGYLTVALAHRRNVVTNVRRALLLPQASIILSSLLALLFGYEGLICLVIWVPLGIFMSAMGGLIAYNLKHQHGIIWPAVLALPPALLPIEAKLSFDDSTTRVTSNIVVEAAPSAVWEQVKSVPMIRPDEMPASWVHRMGFPRPLAATLSHEGVQGVRIATFERGLVFEETVTEWMPEEKLAFRIEVDPASVPPEALDEHVVIGGRYFDVLHGTYTLTRTPEGHTLVRLESTFRLSTHINAYAGLWTEAIMDRIQLDILSVIKRRAEKQPAQTGVKAAETRSTLRDVRRST